MIRPFDYPTNGLREIEAGNNTGITFTREPNPELLTMAERYQEKCERINKANALSLDFTINRIMGVN